MVFDQATAGGSYSISLVPAHLSVLLYIGQGTGIETFRLDSGFPAEDLWIICDAEH